MNSDVSAYATGGSVLLKFDELLQEIGREGVYDHVIESDDDLRKIASVAHDLGQNPDQYLIYDDTSIVNHEFFLVIQRTTIRVLNEFNKYSEINEERQRFLNESSFMISTLPNHTINIPRFQKLFLDASFINPIQKCMENIARTDGDLSESYVTLSIKCLLDAITKFRTEANIHDHTLLLLLLDSCIKCVCAPFYIDTFKNIGTASNRQFMNTDLFLDACTKYIHGYNGQHRQEKASQFSRIILGYTQELFEEYPPINIRRYNAVLLSYFVQLFSLLIMIPVEDFLKFPSLVDSLMSLVKEIQILLDDTRTEMKKVKVELVYLVMTVIRNVAADLSIRQDIQEQHKNAVKIFKNLSSVEIMDNRIKSLASAMFCLLAIQVDTVKEKDVQRVTEVLVTQLVLTQKDPMNSSSGIPLHQVLTTMKGRSRSTHNQMCLEGGDEKGYVLKELNGKISMQKTAKKRLK